MKGTGLVESWQGNPLDLGPIYPFPGLEVLLFIVCVAAWIGWTVWQARLENATYAREAETLKAPGRLAAAVAPESQGAPAGIQPEASP
jgi:hypothetical protein